MKLIYRSELKSMRDRGEDFLLVDVLSRDDFNQKHIPGSVSISVSQDDFIQRVEGQAGSKDRKIVVYCRSFDCEASTMAAKALDKAGFTNVCDYKGGIFDWEKGGLPVEGSETLVAAGSKR